MKLTILFFKYAALLYVSFLLMLPSCAQNKSYNKTPNGLEYKIHKDVPGSSPKEGDMLRVHFIIATEKDSIIRNTFADGAGPQDFPLSKAQFKGALEEGLLLMSAGDSATFLVNADSLFEKTYRSPMPPFIRKGSKIKFHIKLEKSFTQEEYQAEINKSNELLLAEEHKKIDEYLKANNLAARKTSSGLYYIQKKPGTGAQAAAGSKVKVHYTGKLLNGNKFDSSLDRGQPFEFTLGQGMVIRGWDEGIALMKVGEQGTLIIPSVLGYGKRGAGNSIPPNSVLIFDVELLDAKTQAEIDKMAADAKKQEEQSIQKYITDNKLKAIKTASGLHYVQIKAGNGAKAEPGKNVKVHYTGKLLNGTKFDSSVDRGQPFSFTLGQGMVIRGWDEGIALMKTGEKGILIIPSELGYGATGAGSSIPPNAVLVFEVELLEVK
ncbi:MAG: FKBP-type peptidyl-prolyl cis-trans isomerase [Cytophagaceae bacterium]|nr:FKBP-type peptidyl-prolyl cis-trans isomerase [Cytophagaceae bacterium]MDW8457328.1 FKBP-type peptidyl-prolyl cis-trans isomerase [Cytophagaceae bacterium]